MFVTWLSTVRSEMKSCAAASAFVIPSVMRRATSISRGDRMPDGCNASLVLGALAGKGAPPATATTSESVRADPASYADSYRAGPSRERVSDRTRSCSRSIDSVCAHEIEAQIASAPPEEDRGPIVRVMGDLDVGEDLRQGRDPRDVSEIAPDLEALASKTLSLVGPPFTEGRDGEKMERIRAQPCLPQPVADPERLLPSHDGRRGVALQTLPKREHVKRGQLVRSKAHRSSQAERLVHIRDGLVRPAMKP